MPAPYVGGCQCGAVRYAIDAEPATIYVCHCRDCQKQSASAYGMSVTFPTPAVRITKGAMKTFRRPAASGAEVFCQFCPDCGARLFHGKDSRPEFINLKPGTLDDPDWVRPVAHVWTSRKQPWVTIDPDMLQYPAQPEDPLALFKAWDNRR
ncbi:MAG: GFA family protein [Rhodospirillaceae bacterium]|nr:GFA family protein [Rhodospirillaceae bacterium]